VSADEQVNIPSSKKLNEVAETVVKSFVSDSRKLTSSPTSGVRVIKSSDIEDGTYDLEKLEYLIEAPENLDRYLLQDGDILLTNKSTKIKTAIVKLNKDEKLVMFGSLYGIRVNKNISNPYYLQCFLNSNVGNLMLSRLQTGTSIQCITQSNLLMLEIPCPSLEEQDKVAKEYILKLEMLQDSKQRVEKLAKDIVEMFSKIVEE
jgi:restriction endonuclease S subunit